MKNFQVIDGARNAYFSIYTIEASLFKLIFPNNQGIEFESVLKERLTDEQRREIFPMVWHHEVEKAEVDGIDGTIYYGDEFLSLKTTYEKNSHRNLLLPNYENTSNKIIQIVEGSLPLMLLTYEVTPCLFDEIFRLKQDMAFELDLESRLGKDKARDLMGLLKKRPVNKATIKGIDGTLYCGDKYVSSLKRDFPSLKYTRHTHKIM